MKIRPIIFVLIGALSLSRPVPADDYGDMFGLMFRMMLGMMDAMSEFKGNNSSDFDWGIGSSLGLGAGSRGVAVGSQHCFSRDSKPLHVNRMTHAVSWPAVPDTELPAGASQE